MKHSINRNYCGTPNSTINYSKIKMHPKVIPIFSVQKRCACPVTVEHILTTYSIYKNFAENITTTDYSQMFLIKINIFKFLAEKLHLLNFTACWHGRASWVDCEV